MTYGMNIMEYVLIGGIAAAAIYTVYRLFLGWRNSAAPMESDGRDEINEAVTKQQTNHRVATGAPWRPPEEPGN